MGDQDQYLQSGEFIDCDHESVKAFSQKALEGARDKRELDKAVHIYKYIRDYFRYDPTKMPSRSGFKASYIIKKDYGNCIEKAIVMAAICRIAKIPSRLGFANVKNHLATENIEKILKTNLLVFHGYVEVYLEKNWVKATPAFNQSLCQKLGVLPLEFNGKEDSIFQEFSANGQAFMEYVDEYGHFSDLPYEKMFEEWNLHYPHLKENLAKGKLL